MVRFAIVGTNNISHTFMDAASRAKEFALEAVYSRKKETGKKFAEKYGVKKVYTSLEDVGKDPEIDAVYIASPNSCHCEQTVRMLEAGKHVLCEKPVATTEAEFLEMLTAAKKNHKIFLEAMRSVYDPGFKKIQDLLGELGTIRRATFQYCQYSSRYDAFKHGEIKNAFNPALGNAALMDIGIYCVHPAAVLFGMPQRIVSSSVFMENGMEGMGTALLNYGNMIVELRYSKITDSSQPSEIQGEKGCMKIWQIQDTKRIEIQYRDKTTKVWDIEKEDNNMYYEVEAMIRFIHSQNGMELAENYQKSSLIEMRISDEIRKFSGIEFK